MPYYNRYTRPKGWKRLLFNGGRGLQSAELNELQAMLTDEQAQLAARIISNASVLTGCSVVQDGTSITISPGQVYLGQFIHDWEGGSIEIAGSGTEVVGIKLTETIVDELADPTLLDPAINWVNHGEAGAHRLTYDPSLAINDDDAVPVATFVDGVEQPRPNTNSEILQLLAKRTYDESGSYLVQGMTCTAVDRILYDTVDVVKGADNGADPIPTLGELVNVVQVYLGGTTYEATADYDVSNGEIDWSPGGSEPTTGQTYKVQYTYKDPANYDVVVAPGKAYVLGWEIALPAPYRLPTPKPTDTRVVTNEAKVFSGANTYTLNSQPVADVTQVTATVEVTQNVTRGGTPGGVDLLPLAPVVQVVSVSGYTEGVDYIVSGDSIDWSPGGSEPGTGATYSVTWRYTKVMTPTTDYVVNVSGSGSQAETEVDFSPAGDNPVVGTAFSVTYTSYLPRNDIVVVDSEGVFSVRQAPSGINVPRAQAQDTELLIATLFLPPDANASEIVVGSSRLYRQTMPQLAALKERVQALEYNAAVSDLDQDAFNVDLPGAKLGIFTDNFRDYSKMDLAHGNFDASIGNNTLSVPAAHKSYILALSNGETPIFATLAFTEQAYITQPAATEFIDVNEYHTIPTNTGIITLDPPADMAVINNPDGYVYVEDRITQLTGSVLQQYLTQQQIDQLFPNGAPAAGELVPLDRMHDVAMVLRWHVPLYTLTIAGESISEGAESLTRAMAIDVHGRSFRPNTDNIALEFDNRPYPLTALGDTPAGTTPGTVQSKADGTFSARFNLDAGQPGGVREVSVTDALGLNEASAQFEITLSVRTRYVRQNFFAIGDQYVHLDPVAQSFTLEEAVALTSVDLFFGDKDSGTAPVVVSIRNMINGYPGTTIYAETSLMPDDVNTAADGSAATKFSFGRPCMLEAGEYCIVIASESTEYSLAVAALGQVGLVSGQYVTSNPYTGVLFTSANARTWTADQSRDLKFTLRRAVFDPTRIQLYGPTNNPTVVVNSDQLGYDAIDVESASSLALLADAHTPAGSSVNWEISVDGTTWNLINPDNMIDYQSVLSNVELRATLASNSDKVSPVLGFPQALLGRRWDASGGYVNRNTVLPAPNEFDQIHIYADLNLPSGTDVIFYYATDTTGTTWHAMSKGVRQVVNDGYTEYVASATGLGGGLDEFRVRIALLASGDRSKAPMVRRLRVVVNDSTL